MWHLDLAYSVSVILGIVCFLFGLCNIWAKKPDHETMFNATMFFIGACAFFMMASYQSGSIYHPCVVKSFETMARTCK